MFFFLKKNSLFFKKLSKESQINVQNQVKQIIEKWLNEYMNFNCVSKKFMRFSSNLMKKTIINNCFVISTALVPFIQNHVINTSSYFFIDKLKLLIDFFLIQNTNDNKVDFINRKKSVLSGFIFLGKILIILNRSNNNI